MDQGISVALAGVMPAARATGLFVSLATFQAPPATLDALGIPTGPYVDVAGLVGIPCTAPPYSFSDSRINAQQQRAMPQIMDEANRHVLLNDYFPTIVDGWRGNGSGAWRVVIDGTAYNLAGAESDSQSRMTRITARLVTI